MSVADDQERDLHWSLGLEKVVKSIGEQSLVLSYVHNESHKVCKKYANFFALTVIPLSTLSGAASLSDSLFLGFQYSSTVIGLVSIFVGILQTLSSYFAFSARAEAHRISSLLYAKIYNSVLVELALPKGERMDPQSLLKFIREQTERLQETSPQLSENAIARFRKQFGSRTDLSKPFVVNGLDPIEIHMENPSSRASVGSPSLYNPLRSSLAATQQPSIREPPAERSDYQRQVSSASRQQEAAAGVALVAVQ